MLAKFLGQEKLWMSKYDNFCEYFNSHAVGRDSWFELSPKEHLTAKKFDNVTNVNLISLEFVIWKGHWKFSKMHFSRTLY